MKANMSDILKRIPGYAEGGEVEAGPIAPGEGLEVAADELIAAIAAGDRAGVVSALRSAFQMLEAEDDTASSMAESAEEML